MVKEIYKCNLEITESLVNLNKNHYFKIRNNGLKEESISFNLI